MNFLAHAFLSGDNPKILVGNFIGDFVKGKQALTAYDSDVLKGIELHRLIDGFTDHHEVVRESKQRLRAGYRHYAGVIVDVFYDHFLAKNWDQYHPMQLPGYAQHVYDIMERHHDMVPAEAQHMLPYMTAGNWLLSYAKIEGVGRALTGMSRRTTYVSHMETAVEALRENYDLFEREFKIFFPELQRVCAEFLDGR